MATIKIVNTPNAGKGMVNWIFHTMLVGIQNSMATLKTISVYEKTKHGTTIWPSLSIYLREIKTSVHTTSIRMFRVAFSIVIKMLATTQMTFNEGMVKETVVYLCHGILLHLMNHDG